MTTTTVTALNISQVSTEAKKVDAITKPISHVNLYLNIIIRSLYSTIWFVFYILRQIPFNARWISSNARKMPSDARKMLPDARKMLSDARWMQSNARKMLSDARKMVSNARKMLPNARKMLFNARSVVKTAFLSQFNYVIHNVSSLHFNLEFVNYHKFKIHIYIYRISFSRTHTYWFQSNYFN